MFRASVCPSSGDPAAFHCLYVVVCPVKASSYEVQCYVPPFITLHFIRISFYRTYNYRQWNAVGSPDDGHKDARNMLSYY